LRWTTGMMVVAFLVQANLFLFFAPFISWCIVADQQLDEMSVRDTFRHFPLVHRYRSNAGTKFNFFTLYWLFIWGECQFWLQLFGVEYQTNIRSMTMHLLLGCLFYILPSNIADLQVVHDHTFYYFTLILNLVCIMILF
jgi:hypothetical protein